MNLDELKPLWQSYQKEVSEHVYVSEKELFDILDNTKRIRYLWYKPSQRTALNVCMSLLLMALTGC
jgi:hypothetical protein